MTTAKGKLDWLEEQGRVFECKEPDEYIHHMDPGEAIDAYLDDIESEDGLAGAINEAAPLHVTAYAPEPVREDWIKNNVEYILDRLKEDFDEAFGGPDGECGLDFASLDHDTRQVFQADARRIAERAAVHGDVWICEPVATVELNADELRELYRDRLDEADQ